jgi:5-methylcytosine-specific restriction endonuclease McrA
MNWDNYSEYWVLDHVIPIAFFNLEDDIHLKQCFSWFNLRPLEKNENSKKSDKINLNIIKQHQEKINNYGYQSHIEIYDWLRNELKYGKNPCRYMDNQQPSS